MTGVKGFRTFILRGNVVDLAIGVVIGAAFTSVVQAVVKGLITPLIGLFGTGNFDGYRWDVKGDGRHVFAYGTVLTALLSFLLTAAVLYFLVVRPVTAFMSRFRTEPEVVSPTRQCVECLSAIPLGARRCAFCASVQPAAETG